MRYKTEYKELNVTIEKLSKWTNLTLLSVVFVTTSPAQIAITAVNYFVYDLKEDSYTLNSPMTYVCTSF